MTHRILFVCLGNICRSPMAEGAFRAAVAAAGESHRYRIDSAGTGAWHVGEPPDARAQAAARARGFEISAQRARQIGARDFEAFDLVLAMDEANAAVLRRMAPPAHRHKIRLFLDCVPDRAGCEVPDPYYGGDAGFAHALDLIQEAAGALLASMRRQQ